MDEKAEENKYYQHSGSGPATEAEPSRESSGVTQVGIHVVGFMYFWVFNNRKLLVVEARADLSRGGAKDAMVCHSLLK